MGPQRSRSRLLDDESLTASQDTSGRRSMSGENSFTSSGHSERLARLNQLIGQSSSDPDLKPGDMASATPSLENSSKPEAGSILQKSSSVGPDDVDELVASLSLESVTDFCCDSVTSERQVAKHSSTGSVQLDVAHERSGIHPPGEAISVASPITDADPKGCNLTPQLLVGASQNKDSEEQSPSTDPLLVERACCGRSPDTEVDADGVFDAALS